MSSLVEGLGMASLSGHPFEGEDQLLQPALSASQREKWTL